MVDHSMMEFPDMKAISIQNAPEMKSGYNQTFIKGLDKGT